MRDSLLSRLLPSASLKELNHKKMGFAALHQKDNTHRKIGITAAGNAMHTRSGIDRTRQKTNGTLRRSFAIALNALEVNTSLRFCCFNNGIKCFAWAHHRLAFFRIGIVIAANVHCFTLN